MTNQQATPGATAQRLLLMEAPAAHQASRAINAWIVEHAGTKKLKILVMVNIKKFLREYSDQVISGVVFSSRAAGTRAPGPGLKIQASNVLL